MPSQLKRARHVLAALGCLIVAPLLPSGAHAAWTCSGDTCSIAAGSYSSPAQLYHQSTSDTTATSNGTFGLTMPLPNNAYNVVLTFELAGADGTASSSGTGGAGAASYGLTFVNAGAVTQTGAQGFVATDWVPTIHVWTQGGNGGDYTGNDAKHDAGAAGNAGALSFTNNAAVTVTGSLSGAGGVALLAESVGGAGGNVASIGPDHNGNPQYHTALGTPGGNGGAATATNNAAVGIGGITGSSGYWGFAGRSAGGDGGTGNDGTAGGNAGAVSLSNNGAISLGYQWATASVTPPAGSPTGVYGLYALSQGGGGNMSVNSGNAGGGGGNAGAVTVTVNQGGEVNLNVTVPSGVTPGTGAGIGAFSTGGNGGAGYDQSVGGFGGTAGPIAVSIANAGIGVSGAGVSGILARALGGVGGAGGVGQDHSTGGDGGSAGNHADTTPAVSVTLTNASISVAGASASGLTAASQGGVGGAGADYDQGGSSGVNGGNAGNGGNTGPVQVQLTGNSSISSSGAQSPALLAVARGGDGGTGGDVVAFVGGSGNGGAGGQAAPVSVVLGSGTAITTSGATATDGTHPAYGIVAASIGGTGGTGGELHDSAGGGTAGNGGTGGGGYDVSVTIASGASVTTAGARAIAIVAQSLSGAGGDSGLISAGGLDSTAGTAGDAGNTGNVTVANAGQVTTSGGNAHAILAQAISAAGGAGADADGIGSATGGQGGSGGSVGTVSVTNTGSLATAGASAIGIEAQAIGGGSGPGGNGSASFGKGMGGSASYGADGGTVTVTNSGSIVTHGEYAIGVLGQSIGGGGGNGGDGTAVITAVGGSGGGGGSGGAVDFSQSAGQIATAGALAHGVVVQSIGGGGGNAGDATAAGTVVTEAIGGSGGDGGNGGALTVTTTGGSITTQATKSAGLVAQSIGGGGGSGGAAYATSVSLGFSAAHAVGGSGGSGGAGGATSVTLSGTTISTGQGVVSSGGTSTNQAPVDAYGLVAQSIGGGGGLGGSAAAQAIAIAIPIPETGTQVSGAVSAAVGGSGGTGGNGGAVTVSLPSGGGITTQGQGSHAILAQSIGGGGGAGGDSSALATTLSYSRVATPTETNAFSLDVSMSVGGSGGVAGVGGPVTVQIGSAGAAASTVTTYGDYANAVLAQSVGGGGGNAGYGATSTQAFGATRDMTVSVGLGGTGGSGQAGGTVAVTLDQSASITTYGASAIGIAAQSIGGGGGASQGGTVNLGAARSFGDGVTVTPGFSGTYQWGGTGAGGGDGGQVSIAVAGAIRTHGGDATGILAQSIGGGGGLGGSAGADASADNPVSILTGLREFLSSAAETNIPFTAGFSAALGGTGGAAGTGGTVGVSLGGSVATLGDWAQGIVAQSIGGGGGKGGTAVASNSGATAVLQFSLGGTGGAGGDGGSVSISLTQGSSVTTGNGSTGYGAFGILAQSVGGGGGLGADASAGSTGFLSIGGGLSGSGGASGNGGTVTLSGGGSIATTGANAYAVVLQSIGAGGGAGGTGSSLSDNIGPISGEFSVQVGGSGGASGNGGSVSLSNATLTIATQGSNAYGIVAQSIGGGGGIGIAAPNVATRITVGGGASTGDGGSVTLSLLSGTSITTGGVGAIGIVAQSIGGGGGIGGGVSGTPTLQTALPTTGGTVPTGTGGPVAVTLGGSIATSGAGAHGIVAQSISDGGGLLGSGSTLYAGSATTFDDAMTATGGSVAVTVNAGGSIRTSGVNAVGIFAQSAVAPNSGSLTVTVNGSVVGGSGAQGVGIQLSDGYTNLVQIGSTGSVSAASGQAITYTGSWHADVQNAGTLTGSVALQGGTLTNTASVNAGAVMAANVVNAGTLAVGSRGAFGQTTITGDLTQTATGSILLDTDFDTRRADTLVVQGSASLAGQVRPLLTSVQPNVALAFMTVAGELSGNLTGASSALFGYGVSRSGNTLSIAATSADFAPAAYGLTGGRAAVASHLQSIWNNGGSLPLGPLFALLGNTADTAGSAAYAAQLRQLSPDSSFAPGARGADSAQHFANASLSCPQFTGTTAMLVEGSCAWMRITGGTASQAGGSNVSDFKVDSTVWQIGGQREIAPGWLLGGSLAYEDAWLSSSDGVNKGDGQAGYAAVTLKYQAGAWLFSAAAFGSAGQFDTSRSIALPGYASVAHGNPDTATLGLLLRAAYTIGGEGLYLRPSLSLSAIHVMTGGYRETGAGALDLAVDAASGTTAMITPLLEIGGRVALGEMLLRPFLSGGLSVLSRDSWTQTGRLTSAPTGSGSFTTTVPTAQLVGRVGAGVQLYTGRAVDLRLQYDGAYGGGFTAHGGSLVAALRF